MNPDVKQRINQIRRGEVPEGYVKTRAGIMPLDWEVNVPAKAVFKNHSDKKHNGQFEVLSATQDRGIIPRSEVEIDIKYDESGIDSYKKVEKGDFVISLRSFQGGIEHSEYDGLVSPAYTVLKAKRPIDPGYYRAYFKTADFINRLNGAVYGIRDGKQIGYEDFGDLMLHFPPLQEQRKIAATLTTCDRVIELKQKLVDELKQLKKICLAKMFPQEGSLEPEIRLSGFKAPWITHKFSEFTHNAGKRNRDGLDLEPYAITNEQGFVRQIEAHDEFGYMKETDRKAYIIVPPKAFAYNPARINVGSIGYYEGSTEVIVSSLYEVFQTNEYVFDRFLWHWFKSDVFPKWINRLQEGSVRLYFYYDKLCECQMLLPTVTEQKAIAEVLDNMDNLIALYQRELEYTKQKKKALMQLLLTGIVRTNK